MTLFASNISHFFPCAVFPIPQCHTFFFFGGGGGGSLYIKKQYKLFALGTVSCFSELDIHCVNANNPLK